MLCFFLYFSFLLCCHLVSKMASHNFIWFLKILKWDTGNGNNRNKHLLQALVGKEYISSTFWQTCLFTSTSCRLLNTKIKSRCSCSVLDGWDWYWSSHLTLRKKENDKIHFLTYWIFNCKLWRKVMNLYWRIYGKGHYSGIMLLWKNTSLRREGCFGSHSQISTMRCADLCIKQVDWLIHLQSGGMFEMETKTN